MLNRQKMLAALQWLGANPDNHIKTQLAHDAEDNPVSTLDPKAECFCALGRYAVEMGINTRYMDHRLFGVETAQDSRQFSSVWETNDDAI